MNRDFGRIIVDEVSNAVMRDAPELRPFAQRANGWFLAGRKYPAQAEAENIRELVRDGR